MLCPVCNTTYEGNACPNCAKTASLAQKGTGNPYADDAITTQQGGSVNPAEEGDATGGVIPYKNPKALLAYYLGIASGLPLIGLPIGIAAFVLGLQGLKARRENPVIKGSVHAGIGIGCGLFFTLFWTAAIAMVVIGLVAGL